MRRSLISQYSRPSLCGAALGTLALAGAMLRSPWVPRTVAGFILAFAVLNFIVGQGVVSHLVNFVGFSIAVLAVAANTSRWVIFPPSESSPRSKFHRRVCGGRK